MGQIIEMDPEWAEFMQNPLDNGENMYSAIGHTMPSPPVIENYKPKSTESYVTLGDLQALDGSVDPDAETIVLVFMISEGRFCCPYNDASIFRIDIEERTTPPMIELWSNYYDQQRPRQFKDFKPYFDMLVNRTVIKKGGRYGTLELDMPLILKTTSLRNRLVNDIVEFNEDSRKFVGFVIYFD